MTGRRRLRVCVRGVVQGVGFRPFVYTRAAALGLAGSVRNDSSGAVIEVEGDAADIDDVPRLGCAINRRRLAVIESLETRVHSGRRRHRLHHRRHHHDRTAAARSPPPTSPCAPNAPPNNVTRPTGATGTRSSTAPTAARGSPSSARCPTTARRRRWRPSRCAPTAPANTTTPPTGDSTPSRSAARTAGPH